MNPIEELRAAAAEMRKRAEDAPAGTWYATGGPDDTAHVWSTTTSLIPGHVAQIDSDNADRDDATARHMAAWHPAVALAVADLLEQEAGRLEVHLPQWRGDYWRPGVESGPPPRGHHDPEWLTETVEHQFGAALAVARAFMGEGSNG